MKITVYKFPILNTANILLETFGSPLSTNSNTKNIVSTTISERVIYIDTSRIIDHLTCILNMLCLAHLFISIPTMARESGHCAQCPAKLEILRHFPGMYEICVTCLTRMQIKLLKQSKCCIH